MKSSPFAFFPLAIGFALIFASIPIPVLSKQPDPAVTVSLKVLKRFGNGCVRLNMKELKPFDDMRVTAVIEIKNGCASDQLVDAYLGTGIGNPSSQIWWPVSGQHFLWPDPKPYPKGLNFVPITQLQSGFVIPRGGSVTTEITQFLSDVQPIEYKLGSCDLHKHGKMRAAFHDSNLDIGFACAMLDGDPGLEYSTQLVSRPRVEQSLKFVRRASQDSAEDDTADTTDTADTPGWVIDFSTCAKPAYPTNSLRNEETGKVSLSFLISAQGKVQETKLLQTSGFRDLDVAAAEALEKCRFRPAVAGSKPDSMWVPMAFAFTLD